MLTDPLFYAAAIPAVAITGLSKGGFLAGVGGIAVPLMTLAISPVQAAGIMLPILILMDIVAVWTYRRDWDGRNLAILIPASSLGILGGWALAAYVSDAWVRLLVGTIGVLFTLDTWLKIRPKGTDPTPSLLKGGVLGTLAGFTSFVSHTGGPPYHIYMLPQRLEKRLYAGTTIMFFAYGNALKVPFYSQLGQFNRENMLTSAALMPLAFGAVWLGVWLVKIVPQEPFYRAITIALFLISLKLMWDGGRQLMGL